MPTSEQLATLRTLGDRLAKSAAMFFGNEEQVLTAAKLECVVPDRVRTFWDLSELQATDLIRWMRQAWVDVHASSYPD